MSYSPLQSLELGHKFASELEKGKYTLIGRRKVRKRAVKWSELLE